MANLDRILTIRVFWFSACGLSVSQPSVDGNTATVARSCEAICSTGVLHRHVSLDPPRAEAYRLRKSSITTLGLLALIGLNDHPTLAQLCSESWRATRRSTESQCHKDGYPSPRSRESQQCRMLANRNEAQRRDARTFAMIAADTGAGSAASPTSTRSMVVVAGYSLALSLTQLSCRRYCPDNIDHIDADSGQRSFERIVAESEHAPV
jgi:hypothetical protein